MTDSEDTLDRSDREKRMIEDVKRVVNRIDKTQNASPLAFTRGTTYDDAITSLASSLARVERTLSRDPVSRDSRDLMIDDLIQRVDRQSRRIDSIEFDIVALRSSQQPADPTGAHPYRSATQRLAAAPSSPVATSEAAPTRTSASGAWRRVYGALASRPADVCMALVPVLGGVGAYLICASGGLDTIGAILGVVLAGLGSVPTLTWWRA
jgi:hypothetical protein